MRASRSVLLEALAAQRDGVISTALVVRAGFDHELAPREAAAGRWRLLLPGIYLTSPDQATLVQRCHAALLHSGSGTLLTGNAGSMLRGIKGALEDDPTIHVLVPHRTTRTSTGFCRLVRTRTRVTGTELVVEDQRPLPTADPARCVADAVRFSSDLAAARAVACAALRDSRVEWAEVASHARRPGRGAGHLRRVVHDLADGVRSPAEGELHDVLASAARRGQLPPYLLNPDVYLDGRLLGSPDVWFVGLGLGDEVDSRQWHEETNALDATLRRHDRFTDAGLALNHVTPSRFRANPQAHLVRLGQLVDRRRQLALPEPPGLVVLARGPLLPARTPWPQTTLP